MSIFRVLLTDYAWPDLDLEREYLAKLNAKLVVAPDAEEATLCELAKDADAIATCWGMVTAKVVESATRCRLIARLGIGLDNIDIPTATRMGIPVTNVPDYCIPEVADHTLALLLALRRKIAKFDRDTKQGVYDLSGAGPMSRIGGRVLGLIGFGRIARAVRERALSFGWRVVATSPSGNDYGTGCEMVELRDLIQRSDSISLHAPSTESTHQLLNADRFEQMKRGVLIVNTSRGALIDEDALWQAIQEGRVAGAGLDVFDPEPPDLTRPLFRDERVIVTPHAAFVSEESLIDLRTRVCGQIAQVLQNEVPENLVNPAYSE